MVETHAFDVVLMDIDMPELDGMAVAHAIREREQATHDHVPIVAMTAHAMAGDRERCIAGGMDGYLSKPIQPSVLFDVIDRVFHETESRRVHAKMPSATVG